MLLPDYPTAFWISAVCAVIVLGIAKAGFGGGAATVGTPILSLTIPVPEAAALLLPLLICIDFLSVLHYRRHFHKRSVALLLPGAVLGIAAGGLFFGYFAGNQRILRIGIGVEAVLFVLFQVARVLIEGALKRRHPPAYEGILMGCLSGFTSTLAHAGGPPVAIYMLPQKLPRDLFVGTTVIFFAVVNLIKLAPYQYLGLLRVGNLMTILLLAPLTYVGVRIGIYLNAHFTDVWFNRVIYTILFLTGWQLILS